MKRKVLSFMLLAALLLTLLPLTAFAEEPAESEPEQEEEEVEAAEEENGNIWGIPADDVIWYGVYENEPVPWLVLDAGQTNMGTEGVFLFSRGLIDSTKVRFDESSTLWEGSLAQEWCTNFAETAFSAAESALIPHTDKYEPSTYPNHLYGLTWREVELKQEQVFFLSVLELEQYYGSYGPDNKRTVKVCSLESYYWLRSPHYYHDDYHGIVLQDRTIHDYLPYAAWAARPCINLLLQDAVWLLPADDMGAPGQLRLPEPPESEGAREWKLLVPLAEHSFHAETASRQENLLTVQYSGADVGEGFMLSLLIRDEAGEPLSLWRLEQPAAAEGELTLDLEELALPEGATLYLFCEQLSGENCSNYASPLQELEISPLVSESPVPETPAPEEASPTPAQPQTDIPEETEPAEPAEEVQSSAAPTTGKLWEQLPIEALAAIAVLAVVFIVLSIRRRSILPLFLFVLLIALVALVYLRVQLGQQ